MNSTSDHQAAEHENACAKKWLRRSEELAGDEDWKHYRQAKEERGAQACHDEDLQAVAGGPDAPEDPEWERRVITFGTRAAWRPAPLRFRRHVVISRCIGTHRPNVDNG